MDYKIAICDDSELDWQYIAAFVAKWAANAGHTVQIDTFYSAEDFLFHYAEKKDYDILLLDIEMGRMDGVSLAKRLRQENDTVQIIFITGYSDYIDQGYEVAALHYLMKPIREEKLCSVLDRAAEKLAKNERILNLELSGEMVRVPIYQIRYAEVFGNYVTIHALTKGEVSYTTKKPWRQKGTGRARAGYAGSPVWRHGGVAFAPKPRDYSYSLTKKTKRLALKSALSSKAAENAILVVDGLHMDEVKTKTFKTFLDAAGVTGKAMVITENVDENVLKSARNIAGVSVTTATILSPYTILCGGTLVVDKAAVQKIEEVFA